MDTIFSLNGSIVPPERAVVPITDRGFLYGDGLFETMHAYGRVLFRMHEHLDRLGDGARRLHMKPAPNLKQLAAWLQAAVDAAGFDEANVRLTYTRGTGQRGPSLKGAFKPNIAIMVTRFHRPAEKTVLKGATAVMASFRRQESAVTASLKTLNYIEQILARDEADAAGADEALMLNNAGLLCEGSASNISLIREGVLLIPDPARVGALPGIAQLTAIEAARKLKIPVAMTALSPWDPAQCREAFLSGSMREISPLVRVGSTIVGDGKPGPLTLKIIQEYRRIVARECRPFRFP